MVSSSDSIISREDMGLLKSHYSAIGDHYSAIGEILDRYGVGLEQFCPAIQPEEHKDGGRHPSVDYKHLEFLTMRQIAELIFERYGHADESWQVMVGFLTSRLKARKFLTYHKGVGCRMYSLAENGTSAKWLNVPQCNRTEFTSAEVWFVKAGMNAMLHDLWIDNRERFEKELNGYKQFVADHKKEGN